MNTVQTPCYQEEAFENLQEILSSANQTIRVKKGNFLFQEGMDANELYLIRSGRIQISKINPDGKELTFRICGEGEIVGELTLFSEDPKYLLTAKVMEDAELASINRDYLEAQLIMNSRLTLEFMRWMSNHFRKTHTKFRDLILHGKKGAMYSTLIRLCNTYGIHKDDGTIVIDLPLKNQELANFCGTSRESINRMLSALRAEGIVSLVNGRIAVHDIGYLKKEINCESCPEQVCRI